MPLPATYKISDQYKDSTFNGLAFRVTDCNDVPIDLTGMDITCDFKQTTTTGTIVKSLSIGNGFTFDQPTEGVFIMDPFLIDLDVATYFYDIKFGLVDGTFESYLQGTMTVIQNIT